MADPLDAILTRAAATPGINDEIRQWFERLAEGDRASSGPRPATANAGNKGLPAPWQDRRAKNRRKTKVAGGSPLPPATH